MLSCIFGPRGLKKIAHGAARFIMVTYHCEVIEISVLAVDWMLGTFRTITVHPEFCSEAFCNGAASIERIGWAMILCWTIENTLSG
jgi:hypothetical protein